MSQLLADLKIAVPCTVVRGGSSKGLMFLDSDLPLNIADKFAIILKIMGSPDNYTTQMDGLGGGKSTNNKVGIISKSSRDSIDIDYLFCQVTPHLNLVDTKPNCGNFIAAVPFYAIYKSLVACSTSGLTTVKIFNINTKQVIHAKVRTKAHGIITNGDTCISGVTGSGSEVQLEFFNVVGSKTNKLFPTNNKIDLIDGVRCSILDVSVPMVMLDGTDLGINEATDIKLLRSQEFINRLQILRQSAADLFSFGDVTNSVIPKLAIVCKSLTADIKSFYYDHSYCMIHMLLLELCA